MARICPLFSGSSGNSYYIGSREEGILIDVGRSAKQITGMLDACGIPIKAIKAVFVTHEHSDHVQGLRVFASKNKLRIYASEGTLKALQESKNFSESLESFVIGEDGVSCAGMLIQPFRTSHDSAESLGFKITSSDGRRIAFCTDLGCLTETVTQELSGSDLVILESNHDIGMLQNGPYPYYLKRRILSNTGHLSNTACASVLPELARKGTARFLLAHLSRENNTPELAYQTSLCSLQMAGLKQGMDFELMVAPRENLEYKTILF